MFASNYPVDSLVASFRAIVEAFMEAIADRPEGARHQLLYGNAVRLYRLDQSQLVG